MRISIHQPEHMPWLGFFHKMASCDVFVLLDNVQFKKNNWQNRNRIVEWDGSLVWLTVPVLIKGHMETTIKDIRINNEISWRRKYWGRLRGAYCKHPYYDMNEEVLEGIIFGEDTFLRNLNYRLILFFRKALGIKTKINNLK